MFKKLGGCCIILTLIVIYSERSLQKSLPIVINTWKFTDATRSASKILSDGGSALDAVEAGLTVCEMEQCGLTVGFGGSPDENGETTLDAMLIDGTTMNMGAVGGLRNIKNAASVARKVLENTEHSLLGGNLATDFAVKLKFKPSNLTTKISHTLWKQWKENTCQPNFWKNVRPDPFHNCGPYKPDARTDSENDYEEYLYKIKNTQLTDKMKSHDTITMLAIDVYGNVAAGGSTNGLSHKIPGRIGDTPLPGAGAYADNHVGAASATGNGDIMMRFLPSFVAVEAMRNGASPRNAALAAIKRIRSYHSDFYGAVIAVNTYGEFGAACNGMTSFPYSVKSPNLYNVTVFIEYCSEYY